MKGLHLCPDFYDFFDESQSCLSSADQTGSVASGMMSTNRVHCSALYLHNSLPMIENLSHYWDKADGKTKKKILGCIFTEKFENFDFESCNNIFTPEIKSIMLASKVLRRNKNKKEVKNDLLSNMAPPLGLEPRTL